MFQYVDHDSYKSKLPLYKYKISNILVVAYCKGTYISLCVTGFSKRSTPYDSLINVQDCTDSA